MYSLNFIQILYTQLFEVTNFQRNENSMRWQKKKVICLKY